MKITIDLPQAERLKLSELRSFKEHVSAWFEKRHGYPMATFVRVEYYIADLLDDAEQAAAPPVRKHDITVTDADVERVTEAEEKEIAEGKDEYARALRNGMPPSGRFA